MEWLNSQSENKTVMSATITNWYITEHADRRTKYYVPKNYVYPLVDEGMLWRPPDENLIRRILVSYSTWEMPTSEYIRYIKSWPEQKQLAKKIGGSSKHK